jgi:hypothetical protein
MFHLLESHGFLKIIERTAKGATLKEQRAGDREEKARILANFACCALKN